MQLFAMDYSLYTERGLGRAQKHQIQRKEEYLRKINKPELFVDKWAELDERYKRGLLELLAKRN